MSSQFVICENAEQIRSRLFARLSRPEFFSLALTVCIAVGFIYLQQTGTFSSGTTNYDLYNYLATAKGNFSEYYYGYWLAPVFLLMAKLPATVIMILWDILNILGIFFAVRVFGGKAIFALPTYQVLYILFHGQITGIIIGGLALFWLGLVTRRFHLAGVGLLIAATKFQLGACFTGLLWLYSSIPLRNKWKVFLIPAAGFLISLILYPGWILQLYQTIRTNPPYDPASISLWRYIGAMALLLLLPPLLVPLPREKRLLALLAALPLSVPYFQQADLSGLFVLPLGWLPILGNIGFLAFFCGEKALQALAVIPLGIYFTIFVSHFRMHKST